MSDFYQTLGVKPTAKIAEIQSAFRKLAKQTHPDLNKNDPQKVSQFQQIKEAYDTLSNADKRKAYDQKRQEQLKPKQSPQPNRPTSPSGKPALSPKEARFLYKRYTTKKWMRYHLFTFLILIGFYLILRQIYLPFLYPFYPYMRPIFGGIVLYKLLWIVLLFIRLRWLTFRFRHHH